MVKRIREGVVVNDEILPLPEPDPPPPEVDRGLKRILETADKACAEPAT